MKQRNFPYHFHCCCLLVGGGGGGGVGGGGINSKVKGIVTRKLVVTQMVQDINRIL
jgi:hypothetical protein